jgi:hypothetical protein
VADLDAGTAQTQIEDALRDAVLLALGARRQFADVASLRAASTRGEATNSVTDDSLAAVVVGGAVTAAYRWSSASTAADDGAAVLKPADALAAGRWLLWTSPLRIVTVAGGNSKFLHEVASGPLARVILLDKSFDDAVVDELLGGTVPAVVIEATGDDPSDADELVGNRWLTEFEFTVSVLTRDMRGRREAAQGDLLDALDPDGAVGANTVDGALKKLLAGVQLSYALPGVRAVRVGRGHNWVSDLGERRVVRSRVYRVQATEVNPPAPNDAGALQSAFAQADIVDNFADGWSATDYLVSGAAVLPGVGLVKTVSAGSAVIAGAAVAYAGELWTFDAYSDTYRDLDAAGVMHFTAVARDGEAPPLGAAGALRVGVTGTDGSSVLYDRVVAETRAPFGPNRQMIP